MPKSELLTIGDFARACGVTASALRFYADSGLLAPASVGATGYRYYAVEQVPRAELIRRLREIDMPLEQVARVLAGGQGAARLVDEHVAGLVRRVDRAREVAVAVKAALGAAPVPVVRVRGAVFAAAVEQVLTATAPEGDVPVLNGVHVEVSAGAIGLTATDRYRLSTRTLVPDESGEDGWTATAHADDLRLAMAWVRRQHHLRIGVRSWVLQLAGDDAVRECRVLAEPFPDYRQVLESLPPVSTRVVVARNALVEALEQHHDPVVRLDVTDAAVSLGRAVDAVVDGPPTTVHFAVTTLHPAVSSAVGPDVMLDLAGADQPVVIRSADDGDVTTLVMPVRPEPGGTTT
ncbi:DNA polymerase III subunit beta family protein [Actinokineospora bangkokensis]|uniref:HTH merR-type domain-containing protein n=1 Tax=Actinokineospora bangkokensis TaxID=1193682 RepID=A0A1Q9LQR9_9PSEU|nr:MerR family transcriptional regulator [Actinokineospora bangkokensis]OLR94368.1 hypothetical protein BJP25_11425 [Actinokineospora bangkokensis]